MSFNEAAHILDNPGWSSLNSKQAHFAIGTALAKHYPLDVFRLAALAEPSPPALRDLAEILPPGEPVFLAAASLPDDLPGWTIHQRGTVVQMVSEQVLPAANGALEIIPLTPDDVPEMQHLIDLTHPGPFERRTIEIGHFFGIRDKGTLVAMAGERIHIPGFHEISSVCTHPDHQGKGYARYLVMEIMNQHRTGDEIPFLHAWNDNHHAIGLYERMGFRVRAELSLRVISH
jgi:predicted GNAT family acetyltransferase